MSKSALICVFVLWSSLAFAGYAERGAIIDEYEPVTGCYYRSWVSDDRVTNLFIYDPQKQSGEMIFRDEAVYRISDILYESGYNAKERRIEFGGQEEYSSIIKNNNNVSQRSPKNKLLIVTADEKAKTAILWTADKSGKNLRKILTVDLRDDWHLDVKNSKIRVVKKDKNKFIITHLDW